MLKVALVFALVSLTGCTTVADLKPGVPRDVYRDGLMKTTEGLMLTVPGRSYEEVWAAAEKAMRAQGLTVVSVDKARGTIKANPRRAKRGGFDERSIRHQSRSTL